MSTYNNAPLASPKQWEYRAFIAVNGNEPVTNTWSNLDLDELFGEEQRGDLNFEKKFDSFVFLQDQTISLYFNVEPDGGTILTPGYTLRVLVYDESDRLVVNWAGPYAAGQYNAREWVGHTFNVKNGYKMHLEWFQNSGQTDFTKSARIHMVGL